MSQALLQSSLYPRLLHSAWVLHEESHMMYIQIYTSPCLMLGQQAWFIQRRFVIIRTGVNDGTEHFIRTELSSETLMKHDHEL